MLERLAELVNADDYLVHRGRWVHATVRLSVGSVDHLLVFEKGRLVSVNHGPFVTPTFDFSLAASGEEWGTFWSAQPPPGSHDLFALLRRGVLQLGGNLHPFMANLRYFKDVLAKPRDLTPAGVSR